MSPLYNQLKPHPEDISCLKTILGNINVFDFSGKTKIIEDYTNYYEAPRCRPHVAKQIMDSIY